MQPPIPIVIGTRGSQLATTQTGMVRDALQQHWGDAVEVSLEIITTQGDIDRQSLSQIGGQGIFARQIGLKPCYTPVKSPQSNGISEAFVKTLKRDYVHVTPLPDAATVLGLIAGWFEDYNDNHPHSGLKMRSPREFIAAQTATA